MKKPEILAPAGSMDALKAAIANGADAIYLGGRKFGARASSANFSDEEIIEAINLAHIHKVKIYVTMNTIIFDNEVEEFLEYANFLYVNQADALIVQDLGMFYLLRKNFPDMHLHCSTQMNAVNNLDVDYWTSKGGKRVVLARENTNKDIEAIKEKTGAQLEVFVHGALCMSYSGKCLFSALEGGRSGNRGECSQPCRMRYVLDTGSETSKEEYLLSTKDLSTISSIDKIMELPIDSLKLEGRMKRGEYVAKVTDAYNRAMQGNLTQKQLDNLENEIEHIFNRSYTKGYVLGDKGSSIANKKSPKNIGVIAAIVLENNKNKKRLKLQLEDDIQVGDGLSTGELVGRILINNKIVASAKKGEVIELDYIGLLQEGNVVYKTYAKKIMEEAKSSYENFKTNYPIAMKLELKVGKSPQLTIFDEDRKITVEDKETIVEAAHSQPISFDRINQQLSKLGDSIYSLEKLEIDRDEQATIPVSVINKLRREAMTLAEVEKSKIYQRQSVETIDYSLEVKDDEDSVISLGVFCNTKEQLRAAADEKIKRVYVKTKELYTLAKEMFDAKEIYFQQPLVIREQELENIIKDIDNLGDNFVVSSLGMAKYLKDKNTVAHYLLNLANEYSLGVVETDFAMPSLEVLYGNIDALKDTNCYDKLEIPVYQRPILMVSEYCPYKKETGHCGQSECKLSISTLKNKLGHEFPLEKEADCKMLVLGKKVERLDKYIPEFLRIGINRYNINLQNGIWAESYTDSRNIIKEYKKLLF